MFRTYLSNLILYIRQGRGLFLEWSWHVGEAGRGIEHSACVAENVNFAQGFGRRKVVLQLFRILLHCHTEVL